MEHGQKREYAELTKELAQLGFNREYSDPYFELFASAMAKRHKATIGKLTTKQRRELDQYADELLITLIKGGNV